MSSLPDALLAQTVAVGKRVALPAIAAFELAPFAGADERRNNFGFLRLSDGTIGLTYLAMDGVLDDLASVLPGLSLAGRSPLALAERYAGARGWERALGLAAINAVGQYVLAGYRSLTPMPDNLDALTVAPGERVGMVGHFGRLVEPLRARGVPLTVIELDAALVHEEAGFEITLDATRLERCERVIITGTTLLNHSLERVLAHCTEAREIHLLGPSASCLPDLLFEAGITRVGGFRVTEPRRFEARWRGGERWHDGGLRYVLSRGSYPGLGALLDTMPSS